MEKYFVLMRMNFRYINLWPGFFANIFIVCFTYVHKGSDNMLIVTDIRPGGSSGNFM